MRKKQSVPSSEQVTPAAETEKINTTEFPTVVAVEPEYTGEEQPYKEAHEKKKRSLFKGRSKAKHAAEAVAETVTEEASVVVAPEEEDGVKVYGTDPMDDTREVTVSQKTRVLSDDGEDDGVEHAIQLLLDGFAGVDAAPEEGEDEALRRVRQEKIQDFSQKREEHERAEAAEQQAAAEQPQPTERGDVVYPETPLQTDEQEPAEEYTSPEQLSVLRQKLRAAQRAASVSVLVTAVAECVLFFIALISFVSPAVSMNPIVYLILHLVLFGVITAAAWKRLQKGLSRLFTGTFTVEGGLALATVMTLLHTVLQFINTGGLADGVTPLLTGVTGFSLLLLQLIGKLEADRVSRTFGLIAAKGDKLVAKRIADSGLAEEIGRPAVALGEPRVTYFRQTNSVSDYLKNSDDSLCCSPMVRWYTIVSLAFSLLVALIYWIVNGVTTWLFAITVFCAMIVLASPIMLLVFLRSSFSLITRKLSKSGTGIVGYSAIEEYGSSHAVAVDAIDLFPENSVLLHGIKTFSGTRIDEAILDAASVSVRAGGPLSHLFRRMILNKVDMLHEVDTLVYEQDMGLSGWVSGRRVLIGNRKLLDNHGIDIPSKDYEERYAKNGRQLVYLSIAGELSAMFVISYAADPVVQKRLLSLTNRHITLLVRTCDPNITESLIASTFGLNGFYVELLGAPAGRSFEGLVDGVSSVESAGILSVGRSSDMMGALSQCRHLRTGMHFFTVMQILFGVAGMLLVACIALFGGVLIPSLYAIEYLAFTAILSVLSAIFFSKT